MIFPLIANEKIKDITLNAIKENRLPHAVLIEGDVGTGRHTLANFIAKAALCKEAHKPCGVCKDCDLIQKGGHPDVLTVTPEDKKKNIGVNQIRQLKTEAYIKPHQAKKRVFIIDFADTMNAQSQNALLKILEEPPAQVMFILIAESKAAFLDTIISRCVILTLTTPELNVAASWLSENSTYNREDIKSALIDARCNIGKAKKILSGKPQSKISATAEEFIGFLLRGDGYACLNVCADLERSRVDADRFVKELKYYIVTQIKNNHKGVQAKKLALLYSTLPQLEKSLNTNINLGLWFSNLVATAVKIMK